MIKKTKPVFNARKKCKHKFHLLRAYPYSEKITLWPDYYKASFACEDCGMIRRRKLWEEEGKCQEDILGEVYGHQNRTLGGD